MGEFEAGAEDLVMATWERLERLKDPAAVDSLKQGIKLANQMIAQIYRTSYPAASLIGSKTDLLRKGSSAECIAPY
jgi:hypothetical protein